MYGNEGGYIFFFKKKEGKKIALLGRIAAPYSEDLKCCTDYGS